MEKRFYAVTRPVLAICRLILICGAAFAAAPSLAAVPFRDCAECPEMVVIPPGTFMMGSPAVQGRLYANESPQHQVTIKKAFAVAVTPVTFDQWDACVNAGGCNGYWASDQEWGRGKRPAINVSWDDAQRYLRWLNARAKGLKTPPGDVAREEEAGPYRLLTEAEWEYAARGGTAASYYWGETHGVGNANCDGCGSQWDNKETAPVGSFPPNQFGLYDMAGNSLQWVQDCYHDTYARAPADGSAWVGGECRARVMRGGSWYNSPYYLRAANRFSNAPYFRGMNVGFRIGRTVDEAK